MAFSIIRFPAGRENHGLSIRSNRHSSTGTDSVRTCTDMSHFERTAGTAAGSAAAAAAANAAQYLLSAKGNNGLADIGNS